MSFSIGIYHKKGSIFPDFLCHNLKKCGKQLSVCNDALPQNQTELKIYTVDCADLLPRTLDVCILETGYPCAEFITHANTVIIPDICSSTAISHLKPKSVITYGLSCKNTVTVSSLIENSMVVSIQRELVTLEKKRIIEQEFSLTTEDASNIEDTLALIALLLLVGVDKENIKKLNFSKQF